MTSVVLYDDAVARRFEPFATSRPLGEMRAGVFLVRERWELLLGQARAFVGAPHLRAFAEFDAPRSLGEGIGDAGVEDTVLVNTRALPFGLDFVEAFEAGDVRGDVWLVAGRVAAVRVRGALSDVTMARLADGTLSLDDVAPEDAAPVQLAGVWLDEVWDVIRHLNDLLQHDIPVLAESLRCRIVPAADATIIGTHHVYMEDGAHAEPHSVFDTTIGPVLLRRGATVQAFTRVVGPCYIGRDSTVMADRISGSSIGDVCRVHGELSACVFIGHANKGHDGFVGHSIIGRWVNMGAGTITSNLKNTYGTVALWTRDGVRDTGLQFLGTLFGDHVKTGIGLKLTTGCVLGTGANVMDAMPPKYVAPFSWGSCAPYQPFAFDKFTETATRMMARRGVTFDAPQLAFWREVHEHGTASAADRDAARHDSR